MQYSNPMSFWQRTLRRGLGATEGSANIVPASTADEAGEVVVIGGGIVGAATAYWLARMGAAPLVLERSLPAAGASGRNGGLCVPGPAAAYADLAQSGGRELARKITNDTIAGYRMLCDIVAEESIDAAFRPRGHLTLALSQAEYEAQQRNAAMMAEDGFAVRTVDALAAREWISTSLADDIPGGLYIADAAQLHSGDLVHGLMAAAMRRGARLRTGAAVTGIEVYRDGARIRVGRELIVAKSVCVSANAWTPQILPELTPYITPVRGQALSYAAIPPVFSAGLSAGITETGEYGQQLPGGEIVFGGCRTLAPGRDVGVHGFDVHPDVQRGIEEVLPRLFPRLRLGRVVDRWSGTMAFTRDHNPIVDRLPGSSIYFAGGFSGHGMPFAMLFGQWLAQAALTGELPEGTGTYAMGRDTLRVEEQA